MGKIPDDATHWDGGDWIAWHRTAEEPQDAACISPSEDDSARLTVLLVSLLRAARVHFALTGRHLPVYDVIARTHAALHFDLPIVPEDSPEASVQIVHIPPFGPTNRVLVDLDRPCTHILVVRIKDNFSVEGRMIPRDRLPDRREVPFDIAWRDLPKTP